MTSRTVELSLLTALSRALPGFLQNQRWFAGKAQRIEAVEVLDVIPIRTGPAAAYLFLIRVEYAEADSQAYVIPLARAFMAPDGERQRGGSSVLQVHLEDQQHKETLTMFDAVWDEDFLRILLDAVAARRTFKGTVGELQGMPTLAFSRLRGEATIHLEPSVLKAEQSNTSIVYGGRLILKLFRRIAEGINPEVEVCFFLTERTSFANFPAVAGMLEYRQAPKGPISVAVLEAFVPNQGDAWKYTLGALGDYFGRVATCDAHKAVLPTEPLLALSREDAPPAVAKLIGKYLESAQLLGVRTAELHVALSSEVQDPAFSPELFSAAYQRSLYDSMVTLTTQNLELLRRRIHLLRPEAHELARAILDREDQLVARLRGVLSRNLTGMRTRVHGDYHLGQVLHTGTDFVIIDFEGEPTRSIGDRRTKCSPLRDVAGMLRSFHYAAYSVALDRVSGQIGASEDRAHLDFWAQYWQTHVSAAFLKSYLSVAAQGSFLPVAPAELESLLDAYLLEKAIYELGYELNSRPGWTRIPLQGIWQTLEGKKSARTKGPVAQEQF